MSCRERPHRLVLNDSQAQAQQHHHDDTRFFPTNQDFGMEDYIKQRTLSGEKQMKEMEKKFQIDFPFPEMTFGANSLRLEHETSGTIMLFEPAESLERLQVERSREQERARCTMVVLPY